MLLSNWCISTNYIAEKSIWLCGSSLHLIPFCWSVLSMDVSYEILSGFVLATTCPFAISNSFSVWRDSNKAKFVKTQILNTYIGLLCKGHILVNPHKWLLPLAEYSRCYNIFDTEIYLMIFHVRYICTTLFSNGKMEIFKSSGADTNYCSAWY